MPQDSGEALHASRKCFPGDIRLARWATHLFAPPAITLVSLDMWRAVCVGTFGRCAVRAVRAS